MPLAKSSRRRTHCKKIDPKPFGSRSIPDIPFALLRRKEITPQRKFLFPLALCKIILNKFDWVIWQGLSTLFELSDAYWLSDLKNFLFSVDDCAVAAENMMLAADALGIGSCYIGQGWPAFDDPYGQEILRQWDIPTDHYAIMQLLLGYAKEGDKHPAAKPRKEGRVIRIGEAKL